MSEWPYPIEYEKTNEISADVVVLGGGLAGCFAAIRAAEKGAKVAIVEKAATIRSGCVGGGIDHWQEIHIPGVTQVSAKEMAKARTENHDGYCMEKINAIVSEEGWERLLDLERWGVKIRDDEDEYKGAVQRDDETKLLFAHDVAAKHSVIFWGAGEPGKVKKGMKPAMYKECKRLGVEIYDRVTATGLLTEGGKQGARVVGATGINSRTGEFYVFRSKATVATTGWVTRLWFYGGNEWRAGWGHQGFSVPANTGDGMAMAWRAGAQMVNMEASQPAAPSFGSNLGPIPGIAGLHDKRGDSVWPMSVVDSTGKQIPTMSSPYRPNYHLSIGSQICFLAPGGVDKWEGEDLRRLTREGEVQAPFYGDTPALSKQSLRVVTEVNWMNEGGWWTGETLSGKDEGAAFDPSKQMVEIQDPVVPRYGREMKWGGGGGGVLVDTETKTSLEGLFSGGDMTPGSCCATGAGVTGYRAGDFAAEYAQGAAEAVVDEKQVEEERQRVYGPVKNEDGVSWRELNLAVKTIMTTYCNEVKNEAMLKEGLAAFQEVRESEVPRVWASTPHELMHALEVLNLMDVGEAILHASLGRKASSKALGFYRTDHTELDPPEWRKWVVVQKQDGKVITSTKPIEYLEED